VPLGSSAWLIDLLLPQRCVACGVAADALCSACRVELRALAGPCCGCCGAPTVWPVARCRECAGRRLPFATARAAVAYAGPARALVRAWKEGGLRRVAPLAAELIVERVDRPTVDVITPIPADAVRQLRRGHHPADLLATELARRWEIPAAPLLVRRVQRVRQAGLGAAARRRNVRGAFAASAEPPPRVLVVDDVYTTGATVASAAGTLRSAGADAVQVVTFARAVR
jgi:ComF family protein